MTSLLRASLGLILCFLVLVTSEVNRAPGQPAEAKQPAAKAGELPPINQAVVDESISRAVEYLKATQKSNGIWGDGDGKNVGPGGGWAVAYTALAGLALIESGTRLSDSSLIKAAQVVRAGAPALADTYEIALAILFLDRLKDPKRDDPLIRTLAARLIAGQTPLGGWKYQVPKIGDSEAAQMMVALKKMTPPTITTTVSYRERPSRLGLCIKQSEEVIVKPSQATLAAEDYEKKRVTIVNALPGNLKTRPVFQNPEKYENLDAADRKELIEKEKGDNSNTHFALIGLWTARKHDVSTERTFALVSKRFRTSQDPSGGGWGYGYPQSGSTPAMTCIGLLGLAIGNALGVDADAGRLEQDQSILKSLTFLSKNVGAPTGKYTERPKIKDVGGLYYLWALERIAVLYDIATLDKKDWYRWGAEILISNQLQDGSWAEGGFHGDKPVVNTALAILFLKRANLTPDLSKRLIIDSSTLTAKVNEPAPPPPLPAPPKVEPTPPKFELPKFDFSPKEEPPAPAPKATTPVTEPAPAAKKKDEGTPIGVWIAAGIGGLLVVGLGLFFALRKKKSDDDEDDDGEDEEDEKPKKKAKKGGDAKPAKARKSKT